MWILQTYFEKTQRLHLQSQGQYLFMFPEYGINHKVAIITVGRGDKLENFDLIFSPLLKHGRGY